MTYQNLNHDRINVCARCKERINGSYGYDPKTSNKYHHTCWVAVVKERYENSFTPTQYPPGRG